MRRRTLLRAAAVAGAGALAGCADTGSGPGGSDGDGATDSPTGTDTPTDSPTDTPTDTPTETDDGAGGGSDDTPTESPTPTDDSGSDSGSRRMTGRSFEADSPSCGQGRNSATVDRGDGRVVVEGTIRGNNGCYTAELEEARYDADADELTVDVRSYEDRGDGEACMECIVDIDYRATFEFEGGEPGEVTVRHNGDRVTSE